MATGTFDRTGHSAALKKIYGALHQYDLAMKGKPFLSAVGKATDLGGEAFSEYIKFGNPQGVSATFADAVAAKSGVLSKAWEITPVNIYGVSDIAGVLIATANSSPQVFIKAMTAMIDGTLDAVGQRLAKFLYGNGGGALGRIGSISSATITLSNRFDIVNFQPDMSLRVASTDGTSGSLRTGKITVKSVNRKLGTITCIDSETSIVTQISAAVADDYIFAANSGDGDFGHLGFGLKSWLLSSAASATTHAGVDRSSDNRLYGQFHDGAAETIADALKHGLFENMLENDTQDLKLFTHPAQVRDLVDQLGQKVQYVQNDGRLPDGPNGALGFKSIPVVTPMGAVDVVPDRYCDSDIAWGLAMDTFKLRSAGQAPYVLGTAPDEDGQVIRAMEGSDVYRVRTGAYWNFSCQLPGKSVRIALPAVT